jgi:hypothetical protein
MNTAPNAIDELLAQDAARLQQTLQATRRANAEPLPGPLADAFGLGRTVGGLRLRPVVAGDFPILRAVNSPFYRRTFSLAEHLRQIKADEIPSTTPPPVTPFDELEAAGMIYQFLAPIREVRESARAGREAFHQRAVAAVNRLVLPDQLTAVHAAVTANFSAAYDTAVEYEQISEEGSTTMVVSALDGGQPDGLGWWLHYVARLTATFHWPLAYVLDELPLAAGFAFIAWENDIDPHRRAVTPRYLAQEVLRASEVAA